MKHEKKTNLNWNSLIKLYLLEVHVCCILIWIYRPSWLCSLLLGPITPPFVSQPRAIKNFYPILYAIDPYALWIGFKTELKAQIVRSTSGDVTRAFKCSDASPNILWRVKHIAQLYCPAIVFSRWEGRTVEQTTIQQQQQQQQQQNGYNDGKPPCRLHNAV
jgi:hypothetical protein